MDLVSRIEEHQFDAWAMDLMTLPPVLDDAQSALVWGGDKAWYREKYAAMPIAECREPMVDCAEYGLVSREFHLTKLCNGERAFLPALESGLLYPTVRVRKGIASALRRGDQLLRQHDLFIFVMSGWRSPRLQQLAIDWASSKFGRASATVRFAGPSVTPHATGGACDLELFSLQTGKSLTKVEEGDDISFYGPENGTNLTRAEILKRAARRILYHVLCDTNGCVSAADALTIHPGETWHFGRGDSLSALLNGEAAAIYGPVDDTV
jgi:hypothetical protein